MNILVTGSCGFIGYHLCKKFLDIGYNVFGVDNLNDYYDIKIKKDRLNELKKYDNYNDYSLNDITSLTEMNYLFMKFKFDIVYHLAAYAGVPYSIKYPYIYSWNNVEGFNVIIEMVKKYNVDKFIYASSSSVYGGCDDEILSVSKSKTNPLNMYGLSKLINEQIAKIYSELYNIKTVGCRFFNINGDYGRPDCAIYKWVDALYNNKPIILNNWGNMWRDFTHVDDVIDILIRLNEINYVNNYNIINIGKSSTDKLTDVIDILEKITGKGTCIYGSQCPDGEVLRTLADMDETLELVGKKYMPNKTLNDILLDFVRWYELYYKK